MGKKINIGADPALMNKAIKTALGYQGGKLSYLTEGETKRLVASVVASESYGGDLNPKGNRNMYGRYQLSAVALADIEYLNRKKWDQAGDDNMSPAAKRAFVDNPNNWNNGLSKEKFLGSAKIQDEAFAKLAENNHKYALLFSSIPTAQCENL